MSEPANLLALVRNYVDAIGDERAVDFADRIDWEMQERQLDPTTLPCLRHLQRAAQIAPMPESLVVMPLCTSRGALHWGQTYAAKDFGTDFIANYGWMELFGTRGHFVNDDVAAGFLVLGPGTLYPDHHHVAEELYVPLTSGTEWRKGDDTFIERKAGEVIHHGPNVNHAMRTGSEPLVALYLWRDGPLDQKSVIEPRAPADEKSEAEVEATQAGSPAFGQ
jgi:hypothetical protein